MTSKKAGTKLVAAKRGVYTMNPDMNDVYKSNGSTDQVFIESPPDEAMYSINTNNLHAQSSAR